MALVREFGIFKFTGVPYLSTRSSTITLKAGMSYSIAAFLAVGSKQPVVLS